MAEKIPNVSGKNAEFLPPCADVGIKKKLSGVNNQIADGSQVRVSRKVFENIY